jgi:hypothetical protein
MVELIARKGTEGGKDIAEPASAANRQPWHTPQFMLTEVAATDLQGNAATDGTTVSQLS